MPARDMDYRATPSPFVLHFVCTAFCMTSPPARIALWLYLGLGLLVRLSYLRALVSVSLYMYHWSSLHDYRRRGRRL
jgi:hypothetical protein